MAEDQSLQQHFNLLLNSICISPEGRNNWEIEKKSYWICSVLNPASTPGWLKAVKAKNLTEP